MSGLAVASATGLLGEEAVNERSEVNDPTPEPTATVPALIPPTPGGPEYARPTPRSAPRSKVELPERSDISTNAEGKYSAVGKDGCNWREAARDSASLKGRVIIILETPCRRDLIVHFYPDTGEIASVSRLVVPVATDTVPPATDTPVATDTTPPPTGTAVPAAPVP